MLTIQSILSFFYSYLGWAWSRAAWQPGQITPLFFYSDVQTVHGGFPYTPQIEATYIMFVVTLALLTFWVFASTLDVTAEVNEVEGDSYDAIATGLLDNPDYVFFDTDTGEDADTMGYNVEDDEWLEAYPYGQYYKEADYVAFDYVRGEIDDLRYVARFNSADDEIVSEDYAGLVYHGEPDERLIWMYAYDEIPESRRSRVHKFYPWDSNMFDFADIVTWYYTSTYDPLDGYFIISVASRRNRRFYRRFYRRRL